VLKVGSGQDATEIYAFAPGLDPSAIDVSVEKGLLTISGERTTGTEREPDGKGEISYARERFSGAFRRVVSLPEDADTSKVEASYRNGVLKLVVPRLEAARPRQIAVNR
jgi:HSP20 family protein